MKNAKANFFQRTLAAGAVLAGGMMISQGALACTLNNWNGGESGAVAAGDPSTNGIARYAGFCAMQATGQGYVQDNNPTGLNAIVARFYVLNSNTSTAEIYAGYGDQTGTDKRFSVTLDNAGTVTLIDELTGQDTSLSGSTNWLSVEIFWGQADGTGEMSLKVNGVDAAPVNNLDNDAASLESVRLGNLNGASGTMNFDAYESRRSTAVNRLVHPDPNGDGNPAGINAQDFQAVVNDFLGVELAPGTPDCNEDGNPALNSQDFQCIVNTFLSQ